MNTKNIDNPDNLPIEKLTLTVHSSGITRQVKALDKYWVEERHLTIYEHPPTGINLVLGELDVWRNRMQIYSSDIKWLLAMEHHRFWSNVIYHPNCMDMLVSFLQEANPPYMDKYESSSVQALYEEIRKLVLIVFSRLVTNKESKSHWMSKDYLSDIIYDKFIFTIPILFDICLVYGCDNMQHVGRLLHSVFTLQPKYLTDLDAAILFVKEAFKYIILKVNKDYDSLEPPNLPETFKGFSDIKRPSSSHGDRDKLNFVTLKDMVVHLLDTVLTIRIFVEAHPSSIEILKERTFTLSVVQLYEYAVPQLYEKLDEVGDQTSICHTEVQSYIDMVRAEIIDILKETLAVYKNAILNGEGNIESHVESYLSVMMEALSERLLMKDYQACYPVHEDLDILRQAYPNIDTVKINFILQAIFSNIDDPVPIIHNNIKTKEHSIPVTGHSEVDNAQLTTKDQDIPDNIREESLVSEVRDILPHLGDGFILKCLKHYGFNAERVINSLLEDTLDAPLRGLDRSLPIIPEDPVDTKFLETGIQRLNVFDGDQFDIMTRDDVDVSKIHVGKKKSKYKDIKDMLNDKSDVKQRLDIYNKYNMVCDEMSMYSDEYDDTYDDEGGAVACGDNTADDMGRPFVTPRALLKPAPRDIQESSDEEDTEDTRQLGGSKTKMDFCTNPEEIRARREANMRLKQHKGGHQPPPPPRNTDVIGKPKGQGQEKDVLKNRDKKEKHKSSRSNHSRRQGAQWKRTQGMVPS